MSAAPPVFLLRLELKFRDAGEAQRSEDCTGNQTFDPNSHRKLVGPGIYLAMNQLKEPEVD